MAPNQYPVTYVSKEDISRHLQEESLSKLTANDIEFIARYMEERYIGESYNKHLRLALYELFTKRGYTMELFPEGR
jgi:hypothetical protein